MNANLMNVQKIVVVAEVQSLELTEIKGALGALLDCLDELIDGTIEDTLDVGSLALGAAITSQDVDHRLKQVIDVSLHSLGVSLHARLNVEIILSQKHKSHTNIGHALVNSTCQIASARHSLLGSNLEELFAAATRSDQVVDLILDADGHLNNASNIVEVGKLQKNHHVLHDRLGRLQEKLLPVTIERIGTKSMRRLDNAGGILANVLAGTNHLVIHVLLFDCFPVLSLFLGEITEIVGGSLDTGCARYTAD